MALHRLNLDSINSMDLFKLAEHLRFAYQSGRHVPGKTAIVYREDGPPIYSSSQRLFHSFSVWAKEHQLPRDFALFSVMADAITWLGNKKKSAMNTVRPSSLKNTAMDTTGRPVHNAGVSLRRIPCR